MSAPETRSASPITNFVKHHYRHFNAAVVIDASEAYVKHLAERRENVRHARRRDEHRRAGPISCRNDSPATKSTASAAPARISKRTFTISSRTIITSASRITAISLRRKKSISSIIT